MNTMKGDSQWKTLPAKTLDDILKPSIVNIQHGNEEVGGLHPVTVIDSDGNIKTYLSFKKTGQI